jgi:hypothetical protein
MNTSPIYTYKTLHKWHCTRSWPLTQYFPYGLLRSIFANFMCAKFLQKRTLSHIQIERICCRVSVFLRMYVPPCTCWVCLYAILLCVFARVCAAYFPLCLMRMNVRARVWVPVWCGRKILSLSVTKRSMPSKNCITIVTTSRLRGKEYTSTSNHSPWLCFAYRKKTAELIVFSNNRCKRLCVCVSRQCSL